MELVLAAPSLKLLQHRNELFRGRRGEGVSRRVNGGSLGIKHFEEDLLVNQEQTAVIIKVAPLHGTKELQGRVKRAVRDGERSERKGRVFNVV